MSIERYPRKNGWENVEPMPCLPATKSGANRAELSCKLRFRYSFCLIAHQAKHALGRRAGAQVAEMRIIGGGARSRVWRQVLADIFGLPVVRPQLLEDATSIGAAIAGGVGMGFFPDFQVADRLTPIIDVTAPNIQNKEQYDCLYDVFNNCYRALEPIYDRLANL